MPIYPRSQEQLARWLFSKIPLLKCLFHLVWRWEHVKGVSRNIVMQMWQTCWIPLNNYIAQFQSQCTYCTNHYKTTNNTKCKKGTTSQRKAVDSFQACWKNAICAVCEFRKLVFKPGTMLDCKLSRTVYDCIWVVPWLWRSKSSMMNILSLILG